MSMPPLDDNERWVKEGLHERERQVVPQALREWERESNRIKSDGDGGGWAGNKGCVRVCGLPRGAGGLALSFVQTCRLEGRGLQRPTSFSAGAMRSQARVNGRRRAVACPLHHLPPHRPLVLPSPCRPPPLPPPPPLTWSPLPGPTMQVQFVAGVGRPRSPPPPPPGPAPGAGMATWSSSTKPSPAGERAC
jgi:hypothetical protein